MIIAIIIVIIVIIITVFVYKSNYFITVYLIIVLDHYVIDTPSSTSKQGYEMMELFFLPLLN